jgi:hypothetical protein
VHVCAYLCGGRYWSCAIFMPWARSQYLAPHCSALPSPSKEEWPLLLLITPNDSTVISSSYSSNPPRYINAPICRR